MEDKGPQKLSDIFEEKKDVKKPPAYKWQDLALRVIEELSIPNFKRNSVFKACKDHDQQEILNALNDTKELCKKGESWKYFFKVLSSQQNEVEK